MFRKNKGKPVLERNSGNKAFWVIGKRNRENGPTIELANGNQLWYINSECVIIE